MNSDVEYREVPGFSAYMAGSDGSIWSSFSKKRGADRSCLRTDQWTRKTVSRSPKGYGQLWMTNDEGKKVYVGSHRIILFAFVGPCPEGMEACHNDGNPLNDRPENLRWDTHQNNMSEIKANETHKYRRGSKSPNARLTESQVIDIRRLSADGQGDRAIALLYGVRCATIYRITKRIGWIHV